MTGLTQAGFAEAVGRPLLGGRDFAAAVGEAMGGGHGFAAGKLGPTERAWLAYPVLQARDVGDRRQRAFELSLGARSLRHAGVWPTDPGFQQRFAGEFARSVGELDAIGIFADAFDESLDVLRFHEPPGELMRFEDQEPDRSVDAGPGDCWLEHLRGRRIVLVCPFADLLRERAERDTYEAVWESIGKRWFEPEAVASVELPYGFDPATQERYADALELLDVVDERVAALEFDFALIAAGGLGIPLAGRVKRRGGTAISLGGHLQVLFGVHGRRWLKRPEWRDTYINDAWVGLPDRYRPDPALTGEDYW